MLTMQVMACMGIIIGLFLLLGINLTDFTGNIFKRLLDGPKGIREEILEQTQRKKKSFLSREVEEIQSILEGNGQGKHFPVFMHGIAGTVCRRCRRSSHAWKSLSGTRSSGRVYVPALLVH